MATASLQGALPAGFNDGNWAVLTSPVASYPYPTGIFTSAPQVVTGTAYSAINVDPIAGEIIAGQVNGTSFGETVTGANGVYYFLLQNGTIPAANGQVIVSSVSGGVNYSAGERVRRQCRRLGRQRQFRRHVAAPHQQRRNGERHFRRSRHGGRIGRDRDRLHPRRQRRAEPPGGTSRRSSSHQRAASHSRRTDQSRHHSARDQRHGRRHGATNPALHRRQPHSPRIGRDLHADQPREQFRLVRRQHRQREHRRCVEPSDHYARTAREPDHRRDPHRQSHHQRYRHGDAEPSRSPRAGSRFSAPAAPIR